MYQNNNSTCPPDIGSVVGLILGCICLLISLLMVTVYLVYKMSYLCTSLASYCTRSSSHEDDESQSDKQHYHHRGERGYEKQEFSRSRNSRVVPREDLCAACQRPGRLNGICGSCIKVLQTPQGQIERKQPLKHHEDQFPMKKQHGEQQQQERQRNSFSFKRKKPSGLGLLENFDKKCPLRGEDRVVLYVTTLQAIRKTYEQCRNVKMILDSFSVYVDERDISIASEFRNELTELLRDTPGGPLPRLFIRGRYIGGAEEVMQLNENRVLGELLQDLPGRKVCEGCDGLRFIPCMECNGSCKIYNKENNTTDRCPNCNESGLIRCELCY